jgi:3-oxoacyl-[acyl-carrier-protein] synthase-3
MYAAIRAIHYYLPAERLSNEALAQQFPNWPAGKIEAKTGIANRYIAAEGECASDLAVAAAEKLFSSGACRPDQIDFLLLCTQSPDYVLPTTSCLVQRRLGLTHEVGAVDVSLGCSGFIYGLSVAKGLIETGQSQNLLLLTCETYSKYMDPGDFSVRSIFGDGAAATLVQSRPDSAPDGDAWIGPSVFGTDGEGEEKLIVRRGSIRRRPPAPPPETGDAARHDPDALFMDGPEIFSFTLTAVPDSVGRLLAKARLAMEDIDLFVFHQANQFMLEHLRKKLKIPSEKFVYALRDCGNTVSSTIPIALCQAQEEQRLRPGSLIMLVGFGVGYSWGASLVRWGGTEPHYTARQKQ